MATQNANTTYTRIDEIRFRPFDHRTRFNLDQSRASFILEAVGLFVEYKPKDKQLFELLDNMGTVEPCAGSSRKDKPQYPVLVGIDFDPICSEELRFTFADGVENPIRWPILEGRITRNDLIDWLANSECECVELPSPAAAVKTA